jgi:Transposase DDE domain
MSRNPRSRIWSNSRLSKASARHGSQFKYLKSFYNGVVGEVLRRYFPGLPCYERFVALQQGVLIPLLCFLCSHLGQRTGIYYIDSTALAVCHNRRIGRHKTFAGLAARGKTSMGWCFGFKLHLVFNHVNEIVAVKLTPGNVHDGAPVEQLTQNLTGKLFGDKGYLGKKLAAALLKRALALLTTVRKNMKALPLTSTDKLLLNARNMVETIIDHLKAFSSLNLPQTPRSAQCFPASPGRLNRLSTQSHQTRCLLLSAPLAASIKTRCRGYLSEDFYRALRPG